MSKAVEITRNYSYSDAEMLQANRVIHNLFSNEGEHTFITFDSSLNAEFAAAWLTALESAEIAAQDLTIQDELNVLTAKVQQELEACRIHYQKMKYFIEKAFPENRSIWHAFGFTEYEKARKSEAMMIRFMQNLYLQSGKYTVELTAVNCAQEDIDKTDLLMKSLRDADQAQELYKKERLLFTQARIQKLNTAFEYMRKVNKASKIIFADDYAKLKQYMLPGEIASEVEKTEPQTTNP